MAGMPKRRAKKEAKAAKAAANARAPIRARDAGPLVAADHGGVLDELARQRKSLVDTLASLDGSDPRDMAALTRELREVLVLIGQNTQQLAPTSVTQLYAVMGVSGEEELRQLVERGRERREWTMDELVPMAVEVLQLRLRERPEDADGLRRQLFGNEEATDGVE